MVNRKRYKKSIELFHEKSGDIVRVMRFKQSKDFDTFLYAFKSMRYPGYNWRIRKDRQKNKYNKLENDTYK
jgi:hypothetical protein